LNKGLEAVADQKPPKIQKSTGLPKIKLSLPPGTRAKLMAFCEEHNATASDAFLTLSMLGLAQYQKQAEQQKKTAQAYLSSAKAVMPFEPWCVEQPLFWNAIQPALRDKKIVLAEGSTGIGKGRVLAAAAAHAARSNSGPVWLVSSTVVLVSNLFNEYLALPKSITHGLRAAILPARGEFVSTARLKRFQETFRRLEPEQAADVDRWIAAGGKPIASTPLTRSMERIGLAPGWLINDLQQIAPSYPIKEVALSSKSSSETEEEVDQGEKLAKELRAAAVDDVDIIFATHAMLGTAHMTGWKIAPAPKFLIVDETHLYEQNIADIRSKQFSLFSMASELKSLLAQSPGSKVLKEALALTEDIKGQCSRFDRPAYQRGNSARPVDLSVIPLKEKARFSESMARLEKLLRSRTCANEPALDCFREIISTIAAASDDIRSTKRFARSILLSFSPDRRFPSIQSGDRDVGGVLGSIWKTSENGGIAASATIYTRSETGELRGDYLGRILAIPPARSAASQPVIAPHIYSLPVVHKPSKALLSQHSLIPPSIKATNKERKLWADTNAAVCSKIVAGARGGTLILCTSYRQISTLSESLVQLGVAVERLVPGDPKTAFAITERTYRAKYADGIRPIMIALGPAWTGISLIDATPAEEDFLLTDLVIPRMPVALNNTPSMQERIERSRMAPIIQEALISLKQGLGRLVRRTGVSERHLWVLDGRIWQPELSSLPALGRAANRMMKDYRKIREIPPI
jgi:ATP-dependent DNA helicase DinG